MAPGFCTDEVGESLTDTMPAWLRPAGWGDTLLGPLCWYDVVRLARRGRSTVLRVVYLVAMLIAVWWTYRNHVERYGPLDRTQRVTFMGPISRGDRAD